MAKRSASKCVVVLVTCPTRALARRIARTLVTRRLAACVNVVPGVESTFQWKGKIDRSPEVLLLIKTTRRRFSSLAKALTRLHPYDVPEVIAVPVTAGTAPYLRWVARSVSADRP